MYTARYLQFYHDYSVQHSARVLAGNQLLCSNQEAEHETFYGGVYPARMTYLRASDPLETL